MPKKRRPSYLLHKPSGQARVRIDGKDHYLGEYNSAESQQRYDELIAEWVVKNTDLSGYTLSLDDLAILYIKHAELYYRKPNGEQTSEVTSIRHALRPLILLFGTCRVHDFGPRKLKRVQRELIERGHCRTNINRMVERMKRMFTWGVSEEYVPATVAMALSSVKGLRKGRTAAVESEAVQPVEEAIVNATLPSLSPIVAAMVKIQLLTGARPGEVCSLRPCDVTYGTDGVWRYIPESHKTQHHGKQRRIHIGPKAQEILRPYLDRDPDASCFSPAESEQQRHADRRANRLSPMTPSQAARKPKPNGRKTPKNRYTKDSYRRSIQRGCEKAFNMPKELRTIPKNLPKEERDRRREAASAWRAEHCWTPNQLRHSRATFLRERFGIEAAQLVLGHSDPRTTEIYTRNGFAKAAEIMREIG